MFPQHKDGWKNWITIGHMIQRASTLMTMSCGVPSKCLAKMGKYQGSDLWLVKWAARSSSAWAVISLVLVYAGTPTIFANFRTFIRLYLIIFHHYIALYITTLCRNSMSRPYLATLCCNSTSHFYVTLTSHRYHLAPSHCHHLMSLHVTSQVIGPSQAIRSTTP
jgi:hypothetical protein